MPRAVLDYNRLCFMILLGAVVYNEWTCYWHSYSGWPSLPFSSSLTILFVADPQIQGLNNEGALGAITRWDSDRYLANSFSWATYAYSPDVVVFLGDLIDEGSESDDMQFDMYADRFHGIYPQGGRNTTHIFVAGDNDIGGEGADPVTDAKVERFLRKFPKKTVYAFKNDAVEVVPVNTLMPDEDRGWKSLEANNKILRLVASHIPVMPTSNEAFAKEVVDAVRPAVIFSAHDHRGLDYVTWRKTITDRASGNVTFFTHNSRLPDGDFLMLRSSESFLHEVIVPTASYRMGVKEMAIGLAVIDLSDKPTVAYTNLWLPYRFALLYAYVAAICTSLTLYAVGRLRHGGRGRHLKRRRSSSSSSSSSSSRSPGHKLV